MATVALIKYQALGNDFLVLLDPDRRQRFDAALARAVCDRRLGVGADGLLRLSLGDVDAQLQMELRNADGSSAETSGNGLRCAVLAGLEAGWASGDELAVVTGAGRVRASVLAREEGRAQVRVSMGSLAVGEEAASPVEGWRAWAVDVGNPHLVLFGGRLADVDLATVGPRLERSRAGGVNVELVVPGPGSDRCAMTVWERGAGLTSACGSGSCAAAAALRAAGLVGDRVAVVNPGGELAVWLSGPLSTPRAELAGPAQRVAAVVAELPGVGEKVLAGAPEGTT